MFKVEFLKPGTTTVLQTLTFEDASSGAVPRVEFTYENDLYQLKVPHIEYESVEDSSETTSKRIAKVSPKVMDFGKQGLTITITGTFISLTAVVMAMSVGS